MSDPRFDTAAVVLGMHRSGTSALAGVLALTGFTAPQTLLPSSTVNERGFWESEPVKALNEELLVELGTSWHALESIRVAQVTKQRLRSITTRIKAVLTDEFEIGTSPLLKDPRMCRLLPLWRPALEHLSARTVYLITLRSPLEVARSLAQRNDFDADLSYLLWARYYLDAEFYTRGLPRAWISYDQLIEDWRGCLEALPADFGTHLKIERAADEVDGFISAKLRHHRTADQETMLELERLPYVRDTYELMSNWAHGQKPQGHHLLALDRSREQFDRLSGTVSRIAENARLDRKRATNAKAQNDAIAAELTHARKALGNLEEVRISQIKLEERIESAIVSLDTAIQQRSKMEQQLSEMEQQLSGTVQKAARDRSALQQMLAEAQDAAQRERAGLKQRLADVARAKDGLSKELAELRSVHDQIESELKDVKRKYRSTQHQLTRDRDKLKRTQERLAQAESTLAVIRASLVWRSYTNAQTAFRRMAGKSRRIVGGNDRKRHAEQLAMLRESPFFDATWYIERYADVAAAGIDPAVHYLKYGWREGRDPGPAFSTAAYLRSNSDVALAGTNPVLHFIEFGRSEGRNVDKAHASVAATAGEATEQFGPPAPCISFEARERAVTRWRRAARLQTEGGNLLVIGGQPVGVATDPRRCSAVQASFDRLAALSGYGVQTGLRHETDAEPEAPSALRDAWFISNARLRCRWVVDDSPLVVRAYQHDPRGNGALSLVGEGLVASVVDFVDANLKNPFFPVLFVLSEPKGRIRSTQLLAFPSLSRGGLHYAELVALEHPRCGVDTAAFDVIRQSKRLASLLSDVLQNGSTGFVGRLAVDLAGADGTEPLFEPDFQAWLSNVMQIDFDPLHSDAAKSRNVFLAETPRVSDNQRKLGSTMVLPADTIPSISSLVAAVKSEASSQQMMPLAIAETDAAQPAMLIKLPAQTPLMTTYVSQDYVAPWPRFVGDSDGGPSKQVEIVAIRHPRRPLPTESEILVPVAQRALQLDGAEQAITWLIFPEDWNADALAQSLNALALQQRIRTSVSLVGEVPGSTAAAAAGLLGDQISISPDLTSALDAVCTPLLGYLGQHVILHDARTSHVLSTLLADPMVVSSSCVLVSAEQRGKDWHVVVGDRGQFAGCGANQSLQAVPTQDVLRFWRSTYPALRPPRDLWVARSQAVRGWLQRAGPLRPEEGVQLCTSVVTASYVAAPDDRTAHLSPPASAAQRAIEVKALFG